MVAICIASPEGQVGKTALCIGLARKFAAEGKRVGYFKPFSIDGGEGPGADPDCAFAAGVLEMGPVETACPVSLGTKDLPSLAGNAADLVKKIQPAFAEAARARDVVLVEAIAGLDTGQPGALLLSAFLAAIPAKLVVLLQYTEQGIRRSYDLIDPGLKSRVAGVVINAVPANMAGQKAQLASGIMAPVFGFIPQERSLMAISVAEIVRAIAAEEVIAGDGSSDLVENVMAGAAVVGSGITYFSRKSNKAVVVRGERADMHLAALETPTKVLVLTGGVRPIDQVLKQARRRKVPIMVTKQDTATALSEISRAFEHASFSQQQKLTRLDEILAQSFDFKEFARAVGT
ncbi:MAG: phosphotransacetylase family protein [Chloroflexi bacterium]|nr:phosphotransacetylase family protein [Chloroflexota bacterium]